MIATTILQGGDFYDHNDKYFQERKQGRNKEKS